MEIRQLKTFKVVATHLSFSKAAKRLNYAQSSISAQIHSLESEMGAQLFDRLGRRIILTEAGNKLLNYATKIIDLEDEARAEVQSSKPLKGALTIRIPETFGMCQLPLIIGKFYRLYPDIRLSFITCAHDELVKDLRKGITDLAFLLTESIKVSDLDMEILGFESIKLVARPDHPWTKKKIVNTKDFETETFLLSRVDCSYRKSFQQILNNKKVRPKSIFEFNSVAAIKKCVINGIGVTILPEINVAEDIAQNRLTTLSWEEDNFEVALMMIWYKNRWLSPTLKAFMDTSIDVLKGI
jgi:DNA-binding transcriptional LysR family regulator